jgi:hypothetical protein
LVSRYSYRHAKSRVLSELGRDADGVLTDDEKEALTNAMLMAHEGTRHMRVEG